MVMRGLYAEMTSILERIDLDDGEKAKLFNQVLQRYNLADRLEKQPTRVAMVNDEPEAELAEGVVVADIAESVPKTMKVKAKCLMDHLKTDLAWTDGGDFIHDGAPVPGSNMKNLVNDVLRKPRRNDPVGWQKFAQQLKCINISMELVGSVDRRRCIRQEALTTPRSRPLPRWTPYVRWQTEQSISPRRRLDGWESY